VIGEVTSGGPAPTLGYPIAMGYVGQEHATVGQSLQIDNRGRPQDAVVTALPFYKRGQ